MHSEGHIVAHLHITEIEHEHSSVRVTSANDDDDAEVDHRPVRTTSINQPGGFLELPHSVRGPRPNQCKIHTPRTPSATSTSDLLEPYDSSESSIRSSINGKRIVGGEELGSRTGCDAGNELNEVNAREKEDGEQRIKIRDVDNSRNQSIGRSKHSVSDYLGEC